MLSIQDLIQRKLPPLPWEEGDNIPWNEPGFSSRMLKEHLTQAHDAASRRTVNIDRHVDWIQSRLLRQQPSHILDLGCGPGLYSERFARLGHTCTGIDFSPASIEYARQTAQRENLACKYLEADLRKADFGSGYDLAMLIYGEFNIFSAQNARLILQKAYQALKPGGILLLEPHTRDFIQKSGNEPARWFTSPAGLFSEQPHLVLEEHFWDEPQQASTTRYWVIDGPTGGISRLASSMQAYSDDDYKTALSTCGFGNIEFYPALAAAEGDPRQILIAITARRE